MKVRTKEVYNCEYCNKLYLVKSAAERHEFACFKNPANKRPCFECGNLFFKTTKVDSGYTDEYGDLSENTVSLFFCSKKKCFLFTPKNEIKGNQFDTYDYENNPMPVGCELFVVATDPIGDMDLSE